MVETCVRLASGQRKILLLTANGELRLQKCIRTKKEAYNWFVIDTFPAVVAGAYVICCSIDSTGL